MRKRFIVSESEKKDILKLYGVNNLLEQVAQQQAPAQAQPQAQTQGQQQAPQQQAQSMETTTEAIKNFQVAGSWQPGYYSINKMKPEQIKQLNQVLTEMQQYISTNNVKTCTITIEAGETTARNVDREACDTKGPTCNQQLNNGQLADYRAQKMEEYLRASEPFKVLQGQGVKISIQRIPQATPNAIYIKLGVMLGSQATCLVGGRIEVSAGTGGSKHECDLAIFELLINNINIGYVNLNNAYFDDISQKVKPPDLRPSKSNSASTPYYLRQLQKHIAGNVEGGSNTLKGQTNLKPEDLLKKQQDLLASIKSSNNVRTGEGYAGFRKNTITLDQATLLKVTQNGQIKQLEFKIKPLVYPGSKFDVFMHDSLSGAENGPLKYGHAELPYVEIFLSGDNVPTYKGMPVGVLSKTQPTVILTTDLCGISLAKKPVAKK